MTAYRKKLFDQALENKTARSKVSMKYRFIAILFLSLAPFWAVVPKVVINEVVGIVGSRIILKSDIEERITQMVMQAKQGRCPYALCGDGGKPVPKNVGVPCGVDSVTVSEDQVESELDRRISTFWPGFLRRKRWNNTWAKVCPKSKRNSVWPLRNN